MYYSLACTFKREWEGEGEGEGDGEGSRQRAAAGREKRDVEREAWEGERGILGTIGIL